jgi:NTE family protein
MTGTAGGSPLVLARGDAIGNTAEWFFRHEQKHSVVVYLADPDLSSWTKFCIRQSDQIVFLVRGKSSARPITGVEGDRSFLPSDVPLDLVLLWEQVIDSSQTSAWLNIIKPRFHYHVRSPMDGERAARLIAGRATGLVLSGGGARGIAHIGVARALAELGVGIDAIGGASMGALVGAGLALQWDLNAMFAHCVDGFLRRPYVSDFGLSHSALFSGRKIRRLFNEWFGEVKIEETPIKYFCVSTNLTSGTLSVHTSGRLAEWVRASAAIPGVFPPILSGGSVHVDGGVLDNFPISVMRTIGVNTIIGVNVGMEDALTANRGPPGVLELLKRVATIGSDSKVGSEFRKCDMLILPQVRHIGLLDWRSHKEVIEAGYCATIEQLAKVV